MRPARFAPLGMLIALAGCNCGPAVSLDGGLPLEVGAPQPAGTLSVPQAGAELLLPDGPLAGLTVSSPPGAWPADVTLTVAVSDVTGVFIDGVRAGSKLVSLEVDGARQALEPLHVFVPGDVGTDDEVAMVFGYDRVTGELEAMPSYPAPGGTTFVTQHFSEYLTLLTQKVKLDVPLATPFVFGTDDFPMVNEGSYLAPSGFCSGQVVAAISWFLDRRLDGGQPLVLVADERPPDSGVSTRATQAFYADDRKAWQLTSATQSEAVFSLTNWDRWKDLQQTAAPWRTEQLLSAALYVSKRPQLLGIRRVLVDGGTTGHALLAFGKSRDDAGLHYDISDPNFPWREDAGAPRLVRYLGPDAGFEPYPASRRAPETAALYTRFTFLGTWAFVSRDTVQALWDSFEGDRLGDGFPQASLVAKASTVPGNPQAPLLDGLVRTDATLRIGLDPEPFTWRLTVYGPDLLERAQTSQVLDDAVQVTLSPGDNVLGVKVEGRNGTAVPDYRWVDFRWVTVRYQAPVPGEPVLLGSVALPDSARSLDVRGTTAAVLLDSQGLAMVDVSSPAAPVVRSVTPVGAHSTGRGIVLGADGYAFAGVGSFQIVDVTNPAAPLVLSATGFNANCGRLVVKDPYAFVACGTKSYVSEGMLGIADVADAGSGATSRGVSAITWSTTVRDVELSSDGHTAFLLGSGGSLAAFDVSTPANPGAAPIQSLAGNATTSYALDREGSLLFVGTDRGVRVAEAVAPASLRWRGHDPYRDVRDLDAFGTTVVAVGVVGNEGRLWVYDVSNPDAPAVTHTLQLATPATAVKAVGTRAYVTTGTGTTGGALLIIGL